ncbi:MAG: hypothetical protein J6B44_02595 [Muribaculaceae bacterium]|nr:hypothetical protein [Muribaculaceae bacterium]
MKKFLLLTVASCMGLASYAADSKWTASVNGIFENNEAVYSGNVVKMDAAGNTYVAGQYNKEEVSINGTTYEGIGKSAYIVKYDANGVAQWSVNFKGAVTITAIEVDNARVPYIYVAGTFADEVVIGNNMGLDPETITGAKGEDGSYVVAQTSSFIAKYKADMGLLNKCVTFVPEEIPGVLNLGADAFFTIEDLHYIESKREIYVAATYAGVTTKDGVEFNGYSKYDPEWFCSIYTKAASVFSLGLGLADCSNIITCGPGSALTESDPYSSASGVAMTFDANDDLYVAFAAQGPVKINENNASEKKVDCEAGIPSYIFRGVTYAASRFVGIPNEDIEALQPFGVAGLTVDNGYLKAVTYETVSVGEGDAAQRVRKTSNYAVKTSRYSNNTVDSFDAPTAGDVTYGVINKAAYLDGAWVCAMQGIGNDGYTTADFKVGKLNESTIAAAPVADAVTFDINDKVGVYASVAGEGVTYAQYDNEFSSGIYDIIADDENAPVEYFNIQGIRVDNPDNGIYIRRQGSKVSKVLVK